MLIESFLLHVLDCKSRCFSSSYKTLINFWGLIKKISIRLQFFEHTSHSLINLFLVFLFYEELSQHKIVSGLYL